MRTNIDIDQTLLKEAMALTGLSTKRAVVEDALRRVVLTQKRFAALKALDGIGWEGDLEEMRTGRADEFAIDRRR